MYLGFVVETAPKEMLYKNSDASVHGRPCFPPFRFRIPTYHKERIILEGDIPSTINLPKGCPFAARCKHCKPECMEQRPETKEVEPGHFVACHLY